MKNIKVYLQYPWKFPDSPYYKYLIDSPPEGIEFQNSKKQKGVITNKRFFWFSNFIKRNIRRFATKLKLSIPNAHLTKTKEEYDLIHCAHCLSKNKNKPWVADIEGIFSLMISWNNSKICFLLEILKGTIFIPLSFSIFSSKYLLTASGLVKYSSALYLLHISTILSVPFLSVGKS